MAGFVVNGVGSGAPSSIKPYYKYTWELRQVYGSTIWPNAGVDDQPLIYVSELTPPNWSFEQEKVQGSEIQYKYAKSVIFDDVKITWYDTDGLHNIIKKWRDMVWTPENGFNPPSEYKKVSEIRSLAFDWSNPVGWLLINCWPTSVRTSDLTYASSDMKVVDVVMAYDWCRLLTSVQTSPYTPVSPGGPPAPPPS